MRWALRKTGRGSLPPDTGGSIAGAIRNDNGPASGNDSASAGAMGSDPADAADFCTDPAASPTGLGLTTGGTATLRVSSTAGGDSWVACRDEDGRNASSFDWAGAAPVAAAASGGSGALPVTGACVTSGGAAGRLFADGTRPSVAETVVVVSADDLPGALSACGAGASGTGIGRVSTAGVCTGLVSAEGRTSGSGWAPGFTGGKPSKAGSTRNGAEPCSRTWSAWLGASMPTTLQQKIRGSGLGREGNVIPKCLVKGCVRRVSV